MARPLRLEFPGALYHVTCRGNRREPVFRDRTDRLTWLMEIERVCRRFHFVVHAFCQMTNHYHILIETPEGNLGQGMRQLNSAYSQYFNRRHELVGHVMQGRYHAILVQKETYLRELARYIVLNPVRGGIVEAPGDWEWSSYRAMTGETPAPGWMATEWLLACFGPDPMAARVAYQQFVMAGMRSDSPLKNLSFRCILGDATFIARHRESAKEAKSVEIARVQRRALAMTLEEYALTFARRQVAMAEAYRSTAFSMQQIAAHFGVSLKTVSRAVAALEQTELTDDRHE
ncbi:REP-associated tyrosine transposase [Rugamonas aquatica]|uniref:Addiction module toxin RelE n=1 Tax=Rugamonas aquatica TaxID=2743357 RepID=A0A6A7ND51_9BURK|nr:transposase [Rugamonas aquatica]MQA42297.1 addiction module toxin RelE [Rugamonas aquatica]